MEQNNKYLLIMIDKQHIIDRFIKYVTIDTESDPNNPEFPSTENQWNLAKVLEKELLYIPILTDDPEKMMEDLEKKLPKEAFSQIKVGTSSD